MRLTTPDGLVPGLAGQGLTQVMAAFCDGQVADLLLAGDPAATACIGPVGDDLAALHFLPADLVQAGDAAVFGHIGRPRDGMAATLGFSLTSR